MTETAKQKLPGKKKLADCFDYLDALRESGVTNMFGAPPYLMRDFGLERGVAVAVTSKWMKTFSHDKDAGKRADEALNLAEGA